MKPANPELIQFPNLCDLSHYMGKLYTAHLFFLLSFVIINKPSQSTAEPRRFHPNTEHKIAFFINNILENNKKSSEPALKNGNNHVPRHDLIGLLVYEDRVPYNPRNGSPASCWALLPCMKALESGTVTVIDEKLAGNCSNHRAAIVGKIRGLYVTGSKDDSRHMVAMKASFAGNGNLSDSLRFFGVHQKGLMESEISVIGGSGRYEGSNGFAIVKSVGCEVKGNVKKLLFSVYLRYEKGSDFVKN
ncbi:hypothetical protein IEQ34_012685 [Dendrobium chrysotoxum]|uniref:Dirigent protein n=1 Tax=Dendrobium chrysotoxum TaxID=161865 RepID=A0AAV7GPF9_DENCH|nr:hypothetical protein IEQ34_012685 [Dendrobium chrysotoxum]